MGKYMRKAKTAADVALMEVAQSSLGVRTRARTLALQSLQKSSSPAAASTSASGGSYLQLRSRRLEKPPIDYSKRQKQQRHKQTSTLNPNPNSRNSRLIVGSDCLKREEGNLGKEKLVENFGESKNVDLGGGVEASFGENVLDFEGRERSTRESTPCGLIRDPESIRTPGSTTRPTCSTEANRRLQNSMPSHILTPHDMDNFFAGAEEQHQKQFIDKYNFDPVNDKPLPGRFEWVKLNP